MSKGTCNFETGYHSEYCLGKQAGRQESEILKQTYFDNGVRSRDWWLAQIIVQGRLKGDPDKEIFDQLRFALGVRDV